MIEWVEEEGWEEWEEGWVLVVVVWMGGWVACL